MTNIKVWTDGACSGNPGKGGYAILMTCEEWGITDKNAVAIYGGSENTTNNKMELMGVFEALKSLEALKNKTSNFRIFLDSINGINIPEELDISEFNVEISTDSMYVINSLNTWIESWIENDWINSKGEIVKNKEIIEEVYLLCSDFSSVEYKYVKGHSDDIHNNQCDKLAVNVYTENIYDGIHYDIIDLT